MQIYIRKRALNAIMKAAQFVESKNTPGAGDRWADKLKREIIKFANAKVKLAICRNVSLTKFNYRCIVYKDWIIAYRISENEFEVCRFIYASRLK